VKPASRIALFRSENLRLGIAWGTLFLAAPLLSADKPVAFTVTRASAIGASGPVVKLAGEFGSRYTAHADVADNTTFDLTGMTWNL
jgi:hypothetical protein